MPGTGAFAPVDDEFILVFRENVYMFQCVKGVVSTEHLWDRILAPEHNKLRLVEPTGADGVEIVRKFSVEEQFRLMGFKDGELNFAGQSYTQLSKRAANGWDINVVSILLKHIWSQLL